MAGGKPLPYWLTYIPSSRKFSGMPVFADLGLYEIVIRIADVSYSTDEIFWLNIFNTAPQFYGSLPDLMYDLGDVLNLKLLTFSQYFLDAENDEIYYDLTCWEDNQWMNYNRCFSWLLFMPKSVQLKGVVKKWMFTKLLKEEGKFVYFWESYQFRLRGCDFAGSCTAEIFNISLKHIPL